MSEPMITGSSEHKAYQRREAQQHIEYAIENISDAGVFSEDQTTVLQKAIWEIFHAISRTI